MLDPERVTATVILKPLDRMENIYPHAQPFGVGLRAKRVRLLSGNRGGVFAVLFD